MQKSRRSAFTIVEMVVVIAVIAILSAVLIPTFSGIIRNAHKSADMQEVASLYELIGLPYIYLLPVVPVLIGFFCLWARLFGRKTTERTKK